MIAALLLAALALAYQLHQERLDAARMEAYRKLAAITELKSSQIEAWLEERKADAVALAAASGMAKQGRSSLEAFRTAYGYDEVLIFDAGAGVQVSTERAGPPSPDVLAAVREAMRHRQVQVEGVRVREEGRPSLAVAIIAPMPSGAGAAVLRADPRRSLLRAAQQWPLPATSGETLLLEHDGDAISYLTPARHAPELLGQAQRNDALVMQAVRDAGGILEGADYRGVASIGAAHGVPGTDWLLLSKVDAAEVYAPYRREAWLIGALFCLALLGAAMAAAYWRRGQRLRLLSRTRAAQARLAAIVQSTDDAIVHVGLDGRIRDWNDGAKRIYGYAANEAIGAPVRLIIPRELQESEEAVHARVANGERVTNYETRRLRKDGATVEVSVAVAPLRDSAGRVVGLAKIARDVSERRRVEAEQAKLARLYRALSSLNELAARAHSMQELFDGVCVIAVAIGEFKSATVRVVDRQTGLAYRASSRGDTPRAYDRPLDLRKESRDANTLTWSAYHTGRPATAANDDFLERLPQGVTPAEADAVSAGAYPLFRRGECVGILILRGGAADALGGEVHQLLERMALNVSHALDALAAAEELRRFRVALDNSADMIVLCDTQTLRVVDVNNTMCRVLGYSREELIGMHATQMLVQSAEELKLAYAELIAAPGKAGSLRSQYRCKDGSLVPFESTRHVLREGDRWLVAAISRDTRERDAAQQALQQKDRYFGSLLQNLSDGIAACDMDWRYVYVSPSSAALSGYTPEELLGRQFGATFTSDARRVRERLAADLAYGIGPQRLRSSMRRKDGELRVHDLAITRGRGPAGEPIYVITARDVTEQERREQEFATLVQNSPDVIARWGADYRLFFVNDAVARAAGGKPAEYIGKRMAEIGGPPGFAAEWDEHLARAFRTGAEVSAQIAYPGPQGIGFYDARFVPEKDVHGRVASVMSIARDITARLRAEEELRRKDAFYRSLVENVSDALGATDTDWRYIYASPSVVAMYGYQPDELIGRRFGETTVPGGAGDLRERLSRALEENPAPQRLQFDARHKDGTLRRNEIVVSKGTGPDGAPIYLLAGRDITDRMRAEEALSASERRFRALIEHGADGIVVYDREGNLMYRSPSARRVTGYDDDERIGHGFMDVVLPEDLPAVRAQVAAALEDPAAIHALECRCRHKDGSVRWIRGTLTNMLHEPSVRGIVANFRDVTKTVQAEAELKRSEETFQALAENSPDGIARFDRDLRCIYVNSAVARSIGRPAAWFVGRSVHDQSSPAFAALFDRALKAVLESGDTETLEYSYETARGLCYYQARIAAEHDASGAIGSVIIISRDVTRQKLAAELLRESEERLRAIVQATPAPLLVVTREGEIVFANPAAADVLGRPHAELAGLPLGLPLADGRPADVEILLPGGETRPAEMQLAPARFDGKDVLIVSLHDLSERRQYERHIEHLANHDALTGLPNRTLLRDRVEQAIIHARRSNGHVALMFVDLDQFKLVNDSWGHVMGDALLMEVGKRLQKTVREGDTVARLGGDEFVILLCDLGTPGDTSIVANKIAEALAEPVVLLGREMPVTASIGISLFPSDGDNLDSLLQCADAAMYRAKDAGRNGYQYYGAEMGAQARARVETEAGLRQALERDELRLHYQPQVELESGRIRGFEALMRWEHPTKGMISPASFIPVAEDSGLIVQMGQWALRQACKQAAAWSAGRLGKMKVAVNLSARQFWRGGVTEVVRAALDESGLPPSQLELEITESTVARDLQQVTVALEHLRRLGVTIAIDDFGTGYSSLAYLRMLPIQKLKIDRSFVKGIPDDPQATALVAEIIRLAHVLSLEVVAEGVETAAQARFLREAGCEALQGFLVARPMPGSECAPLLRQRRRYVF